MPAPVLVRILLCGVLACTCGPLAGCSVETSESAPPRVKTAKPAAPPSSSTAEAVPPTPPQAVTGVGDGSENNGKTGPSDAAGDAAGAGAASSADTNAADNNSADSTAPAENGWRNWRGPGGRGTAFNTDLPTTLSPNLVRTLWEAPLGSGWSSPVLDQGRVFITDRQENTERVLAFSADSGTPVWQHEHPLSFEPHAVGRRHGSGPKATPLVAGGRVYALGIAGWLNCLDAASGEELWKVVLPLQYGGQQDLPGGEAVVEGTRQVVVPTAAGKGAPVPLFGYTGSPLLVDDRLILSVGGSQGGTLMAFDAASGQEVWRALSENVSYSSPAAGLLAGKRQVIAMTGPRVVGLDARDGKLLWSHPFQIQYDESIATPVVAGELVLVTGDGRPLTALHITSTNGGCRCDVAWQNRDLSSYLSTPVVHAEHVYGMNDGGEFACVSLASGKTVWLDGDHGYYCSPVVAQAQLWGLNERGELRVLPASPAGYEDGGVVRLCDQATWTMPAFAGNRLIIRSAAGLRCFQLGG